MDEEGYFYILDIKKDMIIAGGFNIYPKDIDQVLAEHPKVAQAVAVGIPDRYRGETVKAFVVLKPGQSATEEEILEFCRKNLAKYKVPTQVEFRSGPPQSQLQQDFEKITSPDGHRGREEEGGVKGSRVLGFE